MKCALYARISTADKNQDLETQLQPLREWASKLGYETIEFLEQGISGAKESRPELDKMMTLVRRHQVDAVVVWKLDRLGRSLQHLLQMLNEFRQSNVRFLSYTEVWDTATPQGRLMFQLVGAFAEYERSMIAERVRAGIARAKAQGHRFGRKRANVPVKKIINAYRESGSIRAAARAVGCNPGIAYHRLKEAGLLEKPVTSGEREAP